MSAIPANEAFLFVGFQLTVTYNLFILVERVVARITTTVHPNADED